MRRATHRKLMKKSHKLDEDDTSRKKDKYQYSSQKKDWSVDKMSEGNGFDKEMNLKSYEILKIKKEDSEKVKALSKNYSPIKKEKKLIPSKNRINESWTLLLQKQKIL